MKPFSLEPRNTVKSIPVAIKPKSLTELAMEMEQTEQSDSETESEESESESEDDVQFMPDNKGDLMAAFRNLYKKFRFNIETYNKLVLMLDEMYRMNCLSREECNAMNEHLQKKKAEIRINQRLPECSFRDGHILCGMVFLQKFL